MAPAIVRPRRATLGADVNDAQDVEKKNIERELQETYLFLLIERDTKTSQKQKKRKNSEEEFSSYLFYFIGFRIRFQIREL